MSKLIANLFAQTNLVNTKFTSRIRRKRLDFDLRLDKGSFDIIGDVHGCHEELQDLLGNLGYMDEGDGVADRKLIFLGDLNDRGPASALTFKLVMSLVESGRAYYTPGNHCNKLLRYLQGKRVQLAHGLAGTVEEVQHQERTEPGFIARLRDFIDSAPPYLWLDKGELVVAHAGIKKHMIGRYDEQVRAMCLYGDTTGEINPDGTPVRLDWAQHYNGSASIVYGHTPMPGPHWVNNTINIDQGCVFGGWLTALRWPEREIRQVQAKRPYYDARLPAFLRP
ncbi:MAG: metallophosphoesterase [Chloroflexia bacterium]